MQYLSDLLKVSFSYVKEEENSMNKEFDNFFKIRIYFEDDSSKDEYNIKVSNTNNRENKTINYVKFY